MSQPVDMNLVTAYVDEHIGEFHSKRLQAIGNLRLSNLLKKKNPYLFKAKNQEIAGELIRGILDAYLSSQEETMFGQFLEKLAIYVSGLADGGQRPATLDVDLDFARDGTRYLVSVKSGPNWGNASQHRDLELAFRTARRQLGLDQSIHVIYIEGCCYGRQQNVDRGAYYKKCGQAFWEFLTCDPDFYQEIVAPIGHQAHDRNQEFLSAYARVLNAFTDEFLDDFCNEDHSINWNGLLAFNSSSEPAPRTSRHPRAR